MVFSQIHWNKFMMFEDEGTKGLIVFEDKSTGAFMMFFHYIHLFDRLIMRMKRLLLSGTKATDSIWLH
jgi:hypothetical protein